MAAGEIKIKTEKRIREKKDLKMVKNASLRVKNS